MEDTAAQSSSTPWMLYLVCFANFWYALPKRSLSVALPFMKQAGLPITTVEIGAFSAAFSVGYGCFKFFGGILVDWFGRKEKENGSEGRAANVLFVMGLLAGSVMNLFVPALARMFANSVDSKHLLLYGIQSCWFVNGAMQGVGGPALSKLVIQSIPAARRSEVWASLHSANNLGYLFSSYILLIPIETFGWNGPFLMAGGVGVMTCLLALCWPLVKAPDVLDARSKISDGSRECDKTPKSHSVPSTGENKRGSAAKISVSLVKTVALVLANTMTYFVIKTMSDWTTPFLLETQGISNKEAVDVSFWTEIGAILGGYTVSVAMKSLIVENKAILCSLYCVVTLLFLVLTQQLNAAEVLLAPWQWSLLYFGIGFGVNAPKAVLFLLATEEWLELMQLCRSQKIKGAIANYFMSMEAGTLSGIIGLCAQLGASMSGYLLGIHILPVFGWKALCWMQILGAVMLIVLLVLVYLVEPTKHVKAE